MMTHLANPMMWIHALFRYPHVARLALPRPLPVVCYNGASCRIFPASTPAAAAAADSAAVAAGVGGGAPVAVKAAARAASLEQAVLFETPLTSEAAREVLVLAKEVAAGLCQLDIPVK